MPSRTKPAAQNHLGIAKSPTGIKGLDEISGGGLPTGRTTIVCGGPGCGKTMLGVEFLVRGALEFNEPGVVMAFEETPAEMAKNVASLGFDLEKLVNEKKLFLDHVRVEPSEIEETGDYDLEGLFIRLSSAVQMVGAKRVLFDTLEALFSGFQNQGLLRAEIRRLFRWLKDQGLTAMVTAEKAEGTLTRHGLEEYVSDCVILLDHRIDEQISTRRLRIVKYRGTRHAADEFPFLIDNEGMSVLPATSMELRHRVSSERVSSGVPDLDQMLEGKGYFRGSSALVTGTAGSGKTTLAASFAVETCRRGETCLFVGLEESRDQVVRNASSVGIDLEPWAKKGLFHHEAWRPTQFGLEMHLLRIHRLVEQINPSAVIIDPITNLVTSSSSREVNSMLMRLMDFLKGRNVTCLFTSLTQRVENQEQTDVGISSLIDTWIALRDIELNGERNRCIYVIKSRGMAHSNQVREFLMSREGIRLVPAYVGASGVLTGSARLAQETEEKAAMVLREQRISARQSELERKKQALEAQIAALQADFQAEEQAINLEIAQGRAREDLLVSDRATMARSRQSALEENAKTQKAGGSSR